MNPLADVADRGVLAGDGSCLTPTLAETLATHPLDGIETEFPHYVYSLDSPDQQVQPAKDHPIFFGCYDWHSAVHSHWNLIRQLRLVDTHPNESEIVESIDSRFTSENVEQEIAYFEANPTFERPYGWGWLLRLVSELSVWNDSRADQWAETLRPLEDQIVTLVETEFLTQERPFRVGTHANTAFGLQCVLEYARIVPHPELEREVMETARQFFSNDRNAPVEYEPLGWDFVSPSLVEADLMRQILNRDEFVGWFDAFFPDIRTEPYDSILNPVAIDVESADGVALHFVGLNLSKAWCLAEVAAAVDTHPYSKPMERAAVRHAEYSLDQSLTDEYAGSHWLSSFAVYLLTRNTI